MDWMVQFFTWLFGACETITKLVAGGSRNQQQVQHLKDEMQSFINDKDYGKQALADDVVSQLDAWGQFYCNLFGVTACASSPISSLPIPKRREGFNRLIVVAQGLTIEDVFKKCQKHFPCWKYTDRELDIAVTENDRTPKDSAYAIWVRDRVEADQERKNRSANWLKQKHIPGITLLERLLLELKYFLETGQHLDIQNVTSCSGSRIGGGSVPRVHWNDGQLRIRWVDPASAHVPLRAREVVADA